ncbi:MerR family transcriptional regulator [Levilactobacillus tujiorum]|uniref:MerR family transcriptional regulator n=1 Tax=Levilactobacillus tujiorum TaxID=2912243 RepID=UPI0014570FAC|nr:MerR family transcriptional regulator [Levilactobacillus tujiorum]
MNNSGVGFLKPKRTLGNHRVYDEHDLRWVDFLKRLKQTGMPIREIKRYSELRSQGSSTIDERLSLLKIQEERLQQRAQQTQNYLDFIHHKMAVYQQMKTAGSPNNAH